MLFLFYERYRSKDKREKSIRYVILEEVYGCHTTHNRKFLYLKAWNNEITRIYLVESLLVPMSYTVASHLKHYVNISTKWVNISTAKVFLVKDEVHQPESNDEGNL